MTTATLPGSTSRAASTNDHHERAARTHELYQQVLECQDPVELESLHHEIVVLNLGVADALAARYSRRGLDPDDLQQVARLALVRIVPQFRPEYGKDFLAYAVPSIVGGLRKHFRDTGWTVRPPRRVQEAHQVVRRVRPELLQRLGREATVAELAAECDLDEETVLEALEVSDCYSPASLDGTLRSDGDSDSSLGQFLGSEDAEFERTEARLMLKPLIARLAPRDRKVVELRFFEGLTQREVGERIGVSQMQVSRIQNRILDSLRQEIGEIAEDLPLARAS